METDVQSSMITELKIHEQGVTKCFSFAPLSVFFSFFNKIFTL